MATLHADIVSGLFIAGGAAKFVTLFFQLAHSLLSFFHIKIEKFFKHLLRIFKVSIKDFIAVPLHLQQKTFRNCGRYSKLVTQLIHECFLFFADILILYHSV